MLRNILVKKNLVTVEPDAKIPEVARLMEKENVGCVLVLSNGKPRGILSDRDIVLRCLAKNIDVSDCTVENVMTESLATCSENDGLLDAIRTMRDAKVRRVPVVDKSGKAIGIISFGDIVALLSTELAELTRTTTVAGEIGMEEMAA